MLPINLLAYWSHWISPQKWFCTQTTVQKWLIDSSFVFFCQAFHNNNAPKWCMRKSRQTESTRKNGLSFSFFHYLIKSFVVWRLYFRVYECANDTYAQQVTTKIVAYAMHTDVMCKCDGPKNRCRIPPHSYMHSYPIKSNAQNRNFVYFAFVVRFVFSSQQNVTVVRSSLSSSSSSHNTY